MTTEIPGIPQVPPSDIPSLEDLGVHENQTMSLIDTLLLLQYRVWSMWMHDTASVSLVNGGQIARDFGDWVDFAMDMNYSRLSTNERILLRPLREFLAQQPPEAQPFFGHFGNPMEIKATDATYITGTIPSLEDLGVHEDQRISLTDTKLLLLYRVWSNWMHNTAGVSLVNGQIPIEFGNWVNFALNMNYSRLTTNERILMRPLREFLASQPPEVQAFFGHLSES